MKITKSWKISTGKMVTVTGELVLQKTNYCDGDNIVVDCCEKYINVDLEDVGSQGDWVKELSPPVEKNGLVFVARVGKLALTQEQVEVIDSVKFAIESTPEWQAKLARIAQNEKDSAAYYKSFKQIERAMNT